MSADSNHAARAAHALDRRSFLRNASTMAAGIALSPAGIAVERDWSGNQPVRYPDPDIIVLDPRFRKIGNTPIQRLHTGSLWAEGCAWNAVGRYLIWSDIPNDRQFRWLEEDNHVSVFRQPSGNSNGAAAAASERSDNVTPSPTRCRRPPAIRRWT